jgi:hypothetical protein
MMVDLDKITTQGLKQILEEWAYEYESWNELCRHNELGYEDIEGLIPEYLTKINLYIDTLT